MSTSPLVNPTASPEPHVIQAFIAENVIPILNKYGAFIYSSDIEAHRKVKDGEVFYPLKIGHNGQSLALSGQQMSKPQSIEFFLKHAEDIDAIVADLLKIESPFYSDVYAATTQKWGKGKPDTIAYSAICDRLRKAGKTITGD